MSGPKRSIKITDHFTCTSANIICCITCTYRKKLYIAETGRRQGDQFREHCDMEEMTRTYPNPEVRLKSHCNLSLHLGSSKAVRKASRQFESRKTLKQKFIFKLALLIPTASTSAFHSTDLFLFSRFQFTLLTKMIIPNYLVPG